MGMFFYTVVCSRDLYSGREYRDVVCPFDYGFLGDSGGVDTVKSFL
jgi:hypothetical protein